MGYRLKNSINVSDLTSHLGLKFCGYNVEVLGVTTLADQEAGFLVFAKESGKSSAGAVVVEPMRNDLEDAIDINYTSIISDNPRLDFIRLLDFLENNIGFSTYEFESRIHESAILGPNVVIESGCIICENVIIEANAVIHSGTTIGANTRIRSCSSIGGDGFGFERLPDGTPLRFPHLGGVTIGEKVEIGALNSVARGTLTNTIISDYVKTDNLVHIAHNCVLKTGAFLTACAELSGGVIVGERAWVGPNVSVMQKVSIGDDSLLGLGAVIRKDVGAKEIWVGNPAKKLS